jgi:hypothetical protein
LAGPIPVGLDPETGKPITVTLVNEDGGVHFVGIAGTRGGKLLRLATVVPTPSGWTTMGEIRDGDVIFDETGTPCRVTHAHPVEYDQPTYEVVFDDGSIIVAGGEHQWVTSTRAERRAAHPDRATADRFVERGSTVRTTDEILATLRTPTGHVNHSIPVTGPLNYPAAGLPLDPYLFGCWLGDGASSAARITSADQEILDAFDAAGYPTKLYSGGKGIGYGIGGGFSDRLRAAGMSLKPGCKHIPDAYLHASIDQRRALLAGLLDTDGHCNTRGQVEFAVTHQPLADGFLELVLGLGHKATMRTRQVSATNGTPRNVSTAYTIKFTPGEASPFRLSRKVAAHRGGKVDRSEAGLRYIVDVRPIPSEPMRCLTVDSPTSQYLAGPACIPTHNSTLINNMVEHLTDCTDDQGRPLARITMIDVVKGEKDAANWTPAVHAVYPGPGAVPGALGALQRAVDLIAERAKANGRRGRSKHIPTAAEPADITFIDEASFLLDRSTPSGRRAIELVQTVLKTGVSELVILAIASQRAVLAHLGTSDIKANAFGIAVLPVRRAIEQTNIISDWRERGMPDMSKYGGGAKGTVLALLNDDWSAGRVFALHDVMTVRRIALSRVLPEHAGMVAEQMGEPAASAPPAFEPELEAFDPLVTEPPEDGFDDEDDDLFEAPFTAAAPIHDPEPTPEPEPLEGVVLADVRPLRVITSIPDDDQEEIDAMVADDPMDEMNLSIDRMLDVTAHHAAREAARTDAERAELIRLNQSRTRFKDVDLVVPGPALAVIVAIAESRGRDGFTAQDVAERLAGVEVKLERPTNFYLRALTNQGHLVRLGAAEYRISDMHPVRRR